MPATARSLPHPGFRVVELSSPFISHSVGEIFERADGGEVVVGMWATGSHANARGQIHGGLIATVADIALGVAIQRVDPDVEATTTIHVDVDFVSAAVIDQWLEFTMRVVKIGGSTGFSQAVATSGGETVARASGVFRLRRRSRSMA